MIIRKAKIGDLDSIAMMSEKLISMHAKLDPYYKTRKGFEVGIAGFLKKQVRSRKSIMLVVEINGKVVGYLLGFITRKPPIFLIDKSGFISDVYVEAKYRGMGVSKGLVDEAIAWFKERGCNVIELSVSSKNDLGVNAWDKQGFKTIIYKKYKVVK